MAFPKINFTAGPIYSDLSEEQLTEAVDKVLNDKAYTKKAQQLGEVLMDQINKPLDRAIWWFEHIMRHPTLYSGRSPIHKLAWYQYFLLDVLLFLLAAVSVILYIVYLIFRCICCKKQTKDKAKRD